MTITGNVLLSGTFTGVGQSASIELWGEFNLSLYGTFTATVQLERSMDGSNWMAVSADGIGTPASYTKAIGLAGLEIEPAVLYRLDCTAWTSGTVIYRISQSPFRPIG